MLQLHAAHLMNNISSTVVICVAEMQTDAVLQDDVEM
jgi:hypothetical protein